MNKLTVLAFGLVAVVTGVGQRVDTATSVMNLLPSLLGVVMSLLHWLVRWLA